MGGASGGGASGGGAEDGRASGGGSGNEGGGRASRGGGNDKDGGRSTNGGGGNDDEGGGDLHEFLEAMAVEVDRLGESVERLSQGRQSEHAVLLAEVDARFRWLTDELSARLVTMGNELVAVKGQLERLNLASARIETAPADAPTDADGIAPDSGDRAAAKVGETQEPETAHRQEVVPSGPTPGEPSINGASPAPARQPAPPSALVDELPRRVGQLRRSTRARGTLVDLLSSVLHSAT